VDDVIGVSRPAQRSIKDKVMLRSIRQLYGRKLGTSDGDIGHVKDFYFNDQQWAVRYVVADTGSWLSGRLVLISPHAFGNFYQDGDCLLVNLTRQQIENSPAIEEHKPVSRQYEEDYYRYYGWPSYWDGGGMWGVGGFPVAPPPHLLPSEQASGSRPHNGDDPHLRSTQALSGYHIQTSEGAIGHVTDFIMDDKSWAIRHLVVETGHWFSGKEIVISPKHIDRISYEESKVFVNVTKEAILEAPEYHATSAICLLEPSHTTHA
jgi:sporulation protein YlmC with PRC-barrel domain